MYIIKVSNTGEINSVMICYKYYCKVFFDQPRKINASLVRAKHIGSNNLIHLYTGDLSQVDIVDVPYPIPEDIDTYAYSIGVAMGWIKNDE